MYTRRMVAQTHTQSYIFSEPVLLN